MPKPPTPPDLKHCLKCGKVIGPHKGWFGPECDCGQPTGNAALLHSHGAGVGSRKPTRTKPVGKSG